MVCVESRFPVAPVAAALARAFPLFSKKTSTSDESGDGSEEQRVHVTFVDGDGAVVRTPAELDAAAAAAEGVRLACRLVDAHPEELTTTAYAAECRALFADDDTVSIEEVVGEELRERGYGGLYHVGKAATAPPRLVVLDYVPPPEAVAAAGAGAGEGDDGDGDGEDVATAPASSAVTLVGKGIVYDTGGLALKPRTGMCGMKHDMAGSAGVLGASCRASSC